MTSTDILISVGGGLIVLATLIDIIATVIGVSGGHGLISRSVSRPLWSMALRWHNHREAHGLLRAMGPAIFIAVTVAWAALLILGWWLVFLPDGALNPRGDRDLDAWDRFDYAASLIFGGGTQTVTAAGQPWSALARIGRFSGVGLASFGLAYALPVVGSVVRFRSAARSIAGLAVPDGSIDDAASLDGDDSVIHLFLINLTGELQQLAQQVHAYPIVPYFHSRDRDAALSVQTLRLARFAHGEPAADSIPESALVPLRASLEALTSVVSVYFDPESSSRVPDVTTGALDQAEAWVRRDGWARGDLGNASAAPTERG